ncbi:ricin-type beta-trefoil lectin domain protein [Streptomyces sp. NPDC047718]|uniref:ricin-type beta-trefoil lectin domain protein n=1 Tax=Streptomyces sp. NPDC047718 TaxID=3155479 RepID=UPI00340378AA
MLVASLLPAQAWAAPPGDRTGVDLPGLQKDLKAKLDEVEAAKLNGWNGEGPRPPDPYDPKALAPPAGGTATVTLSGDQAVQMGTLPITIGKAANATTAPSGTWTAAVETRTATEAASVDGALIKITPPADASAPVDVRLDYTKFRDLYGSEWASRLQLKQFPACFLETPDLPECSVGKDIPSTNIPSEKAVVATVDPTTATVQGMRTMTGSAGGGAVALVASDSAAGSSGSYKATSLSPSGTWTAGSSSGGFSWTYPLTIPPAPAGPAPSVAFSYSSQAVDGKTSVTNGQASWIGDGWDYNPGFIERRYRTCADDRDNKVAKPNNDNATDKKKGDLCWAGDNVVLSFGGATTELVKDAASGKWVPSADDGSRVELKTGAANGAKDGEYWIVTTRDGTRYHYGRHNVGTHGDGTTPMTVTDSVFTVPVFGNHPGEPCYQSTYANSSCTQAWRWNLDYVEDVHGNAMVIDWKKEENRYAKNEQSTEKDRAKVGYIRGGYPLRILYGLRADNLAGAPAGSVDFEVQERCFEEHDDKCGNDQFKSKNAGDKRGWWDTPTTLHCEMDAPHCSVSSPTFWSRMRLAKVTTRAQRTEGSTQLTKVDQWALEQSFPGHRTDTHPPLWLKSIKRTGYSAGNSSIGVSLPAVSFLFNEANMPNRVGKSANEATPDFDRLRVERILTETGGEIDVQYSAPCPVGTGDLKQEGNTTRCFPVRWSADPDLEPEKVPVEWFNKYVVESVVERDRVALRPAVTTTYKYEGDPAWAKEDDEFTKPELRTYSQWRGYASVRTTTGETANAGTPTATEKAETLTRYFRGLSRPEAKVTIKDSTGTEDLGEDKPQYQGQTAETITYTKAGGSVESRHLTWPRDVETASRPRNNTTPLKAYRKGIDRTDEIQNLSAGKARMVRTRSTYEDTYGLPKSTQTEVLENKGTGWTTVEQSCEKPTYVHNTDKNLIGLPAEVRETAGDCTDASTATGTVLSAVRTSFDAVNAFGAAPTKGLPYQVDSLDAAGTGWTPSTRTEYDALGRAIKAYDAAGNAATTAFSPSTGPAFAMTATNALGHTVTTKVDPARGSVLEATDANGRKVTTAYDELGRTTKVWTPSQKPATDNPAYKFDYQIEELKTPAVTSYALKDNGTYNTSVEIYDGLLRPRQTQSQAPGGARLVTDTLYTANGTVGQTNNAYLAEGKPDTAIFVPQSMTAVLNSTQTAYDGLGRPVRTTTLQQGTPQQSAISQYGGDWTLTRSAMSPTGATPLAGSRAIKTTTDALDRTTLVEHYTSTNPADVDPNKANNPATNKTAYSYDARGKLAKVTDPAGNSWTYTYDARGRMTSSDDPDMGKATFTYNNLDQQVSSTDSRGLTQVTKYDVLGRKTALHDDSEAGPVVATWTYDTLPGAKGQPVSSTRNWGSGSYVTEVTGYDSEYRPTGSRITIPNLPSTTGLAGTYAYSTTYTPTGKVQSTTLPATIGGLAAEKLVTRYNADGMVQTMSGLTWYTADTIYSPFGQVLRTASGAAPHRVWTSNTYDPHTGRVTEATSHRETKDDVYKDSNLVSTLTYTYDKVGNPTSITDAQPGGRIDRQCYTYDAIGRLTRAWTGKTAGCPTGPTGPTLAEVGSATPGDAYWQDYEFDAIGNRTKRIDHDLTNTAYDDETTYTYGVPLAGGAQPAVTKQPHALTQVNKTTKTPTSTVNSLSTYTYDAAGNTKTRRIDGDTQTLNWDPRNKLTSATSPGIGAVAVTGLAGKCLDVENGSTAEGAAVQLLSCNETKPQQWRFTGSTVQALGKCLTAEGGDARLRTCDGRPEQKFTYNASNKALYTGTNSCVTVPNDNAAEGNDLDIYTCASPAPTPAQQWSFSNTTNYLYDASGNRVIEETGSARTLYLGESEITVNKAGQAVDAVRYYGSAGSPTTVRRTNGKATGHTLSVLLTDHHNTATTSIEQAPGQQDTRRKSDPYGNPRGAQPSDWPGDHTFVGTGVDDNTTALTHIGAREYEPATGRFISVDPIIDITDPLQMNGYTYSGGNPITGSDPSGLRSEECGTLYNCNGNTVITAKNSSQITYVNERRQRRYYQTLTRYTHKSTWRELQIRKNQVRAKQDEERNKRDHKPSVTNFVTGVGRGMASADAMLPHGPIASTLGISGRDQYNWVLGQLGIQSDENALESILGELLSPSPFGGKIARGIKALRALKACNSFVAGTKVQLADGTSKPIEEVAQGDEVLATNPDTGETQAKGVTGTIYTEDDKKYVDVGVQTADGVETITTTDHHLFWSESDQKWKNAGDLKPGTTLRTDDGKSAPIVRTRAYQAVKETYDLTVADFHAYYVLAGATPVLVHNCNPITKAVDELPKDFDRRTVGVLDVGVDQLPLSSGPDGQSQMLGNLPGRTKQNFDHAETHAAAFLRMNPGIRKAVLYIDNKFGMCPGRDGCAARIEDMLPEGAQLWVNSNGRKYGPYTGNAN